MPRRRTGLVLLLSLALVGPAWAACQAEAPGRFEDHGDGSVTDRQTGLMWLRCAQGQSWAPGVCRGAGAGHGWAGLPAVADGVNQRGEHFFNDWRVPRVHEIAGLAERHCAAQRVDGTAFPGPHAALVWTATTRVGQGVAQQAYAFGFGGEGVQIRPKDEAHLVWLVRNTP